jgi:cytochrome c553
VTIDEVLAPGGQDGLMGLALDLDNNVVYTAYTYTDTSLPPHETRAATSPYRFLYTKIVRLTYDRAKETLGNPGHARRGHAGGQRPSGRADEDRSGSQAVLHDRRPGKRSARQLLRPYRAQRLPTQAEIQAKSYAAYVGKSLRLNLDGSIPNDNPAIAGVRSHVFTYGHRNPQGIDFGPDGTLYESEHGPKTDDEINILKAGANYGWPHVAGKKDGNAYEYARWAESTTPCAQIKFSDLAIPPTVPREPESAFTKAIQRADRDDVHGADRVQLQRSGVQRHRLYLLADGGRVEHRILRVSAHDRHPRLGEALLVTTLKRGSLYVVALSADGQSVRGPFSRYFQSDNRYRDTAGQPRRQDDLHCDRSRGPGRGDGGRHHARDDQQGIDPRVHLRRGRDRCGGGAAAHDQHVLRPNRRPGCGGRRSAIHGAQAAAGKTAFDADCAVCHGNTLTNGTMAPPLAGEAFRALWAGRPVRALHDSARTMPPANPGSLPDETYASLIAYILQMNDYAAGETAFTTGDGTTLR